MPRCGHGKIAIGTALPKATTRRVDETRNASDDTLAHRAAVHAVREDVGKPQPLLPVFVLVAKEMLGEQHADLRTYLTRRQQDGQQYQSTEQEHGLRDPAPRPAVQAYVVTGTRHQQQVTAGNQQRRGMKRDVSGYEQIRAADGIAGQ